MDEQERKELLNLLNSHGQSFLDAFNLPQPNLARRQPKQKKKPNETNVLEAIGDMLPNDPQEGAHLAEDIEPSSRRIPDVVIFDERAQTSALSVSRSKRAFMSSKINRVTEIPGSSLSGPVAGRSSDSEEEHSNTRNDKLLHELVNSQLLNNTQAYDPNQSSARRSRMMAGRLVELAEEAKAGQGVASLVSKERSRHAQRVRIGLREKAKQREAKALEETKALGNYHPSIKRNFMSLSSKSAKQRRERGLALGIGKFRNGALTLSKGELSSVQGPAGKAARSSKGGNR